MNQRVTRILRWLPFVGMALVSLWVASGLPHPRRPFSVDLSVSPDALVYSLAKLEHYESTALFFALAALAVGARRVVTPFGLAMAIGVAWELAESTAPRHTARLADLAPDFVAAATCAGFLAVGRVLVRQYPGRHRFSPDRMLPAVVAATCVAYVVGCAGHQPRPVATPVASSLEGRTSVRVLESEPHQPKPNATDVQITPAFASDENRLPDYPAFALKAGCQLGVVPIRLYIGRDGNVARTNSVPNHPVADDQCHSAFWAATVSAVQAWRFSPAYRQTPKPGPDVDGDGKPDFSRWEQEPVMIYIDFEFTFRVVEGRGQVLSR